MNNDKNNQEEPSGIGNAVNDIENSNELNLNSSFLNKSSPMSSNSPQFSDLDRQSSFSINDPSQDQDRNLDANFNNFSGMYDINPDINSPNNSGISVINLGNNPASNQNSGTPSVHNSRHHSVANQKSKQKPTSVKNSRNSNSTGAVSDGVEYAENLKEKANDLIVSIIANLQYLVKNDIIDSVKALNQIRKRIPPSENTFEYLPLHEEPSKLSTRPFKPYYAQVKNNKS